MKRNNATTHPAYDCRYKQLLCNTRGSLLADKIHVQEFRHHVDATFITTWRWYSILVHHLSAQLWWERKQLSPLPQHMTKYWHVLLSVILSVSMIYCAQNDQHYHVLLYSSPWRHVAMQPCSVTLHYALVPICAMKNAIWYMLLLNNSCAYHNTGTRFDLIYQRHDLSHAVLLLATAYNTTSMAISYIDGKHAPGPIKHHRATH